MIAFTRTRDYELVRAVLTDPTQYRMASEDATPAAADFRPNEDDRILYVAAYEDDELLGIFTLIPQNAVCFEIHFAARPAAWGPRTRDALRGAITWAWTHTPARRIVAAIPAYNRLALKLARDAGFTQFGRNPASFLKYGQLYNQILIGVSKP